ncbi:MAG TPA: peptidoglycan DD-metalloendopeptidase family protein [Candidatus Pacearchaeota archaeon]|nr:peptidoglycan DD-metalloendopeptidase family protein [Candidatus Parcubacteria bacterium]HOU45648.1 peptidoglycan DD-metalloendopeptidase family protein [Candidatus Pacearchaeota archaeon]HPM08290.1 peptidoglycan DD-metalloendopeptidase family protein [Candidatus Pacearchaeota archaeon]
MIRVKKLKIGKKSLFYLCLIFLFLWGFFSSVKGNSSDYMTANVMESQSIIAFSQDKQNIDSPSYSLLEDNSIMEVSSPENANLITLGAISDDSASDEKRRSVEEYIVQKGDSYQKIADNFNIKLETLLWANGLSKKDKIAIGQSLIILPIDGIIYSVKDGDSLNNIAKRYKADVEEILTFNEIDDQTKLYPGDMIIIPGGQMSSSQTAVANANSFKPSGESVPEGYFICPVPRTNGICYQSQGLHWYNAVDFTVGGYACGKPVYASASGKILKTKTGWNGGAGNYVKIVHPSGLTTMYGHMSKIFVSEGQEVANGEVIGLIGNTGKVIGATGCHVHFEVGSSNGRAPRNPFAK